MSIEELKKKVSDLEAKISATEDADEKLELENNLEEAKEELSTAEAAGKSTEPDEEETLEQKIERLADAKLAKMKSNMDKMADKLAAAEKEKADLEQSQKDAKMKKLEEEGKVQELAEMKVAEAEAKLRLLETENTSLKRDQVLTSALSGLDFKNDRSLELARKDIVDQLVKDETGKWTHSSGVSITDFVKSYSQDQDNEFLFRAKTNSGMGKQNPAGVSDTSKSKKISEMSQAEVLKLAASGKLGTFGY